MFSMRRIATTYAVEVSTTEFEALLKAERAAVDTDYAHKTLDLALVELPGVGPVDYDGHFGPYITVTIDADDDTEDLKSRVVRTIWRHMDRATGR